ncbi:hypothetical protein OESDEN_09511 [Oesophagostomum dentatum]|uniref:Kunitz/Bovine pancreatic trypsin inhibitor domain protein n=1 Tax=Oesophagostomum dentatum TaxID=61180 RepID=A0A0B1T4G2_OESDE|nr:hypothetical protein OESDEN_09511 [Oesophagostomum dentatum]
MRLLVFLLLLVAIVGGKPAGRRRWKTLAICHMSVLSPDEPHNILCRKKLPNRKPVRAYTYSGGKCKAFDWDTCSTRGPNFYLALSSCKILCDGGPS